MKYRVTSERWDIPTKSVAEFEASSDEEATKRFHSTEFAKNPNYKWDHLILYRIEQVEKVARVDSVRLS